MNAANILSINASTLKTGDTVVLGSTQILHLSFRTNPTTGYNEFLVNAEQVQSAGLLKPTNLEQNTGSYQQDDCPQGICGVGGATTFEFQPMLQQNQESFTQQLEFLYERPWQLQSSLQETFKVNVQVNKD